MAAAITGVFEESLQKKITESKIFVVGAGGIGCEVLKNLVLSGFSDIEIVSKIHFSSTLSGYVNESFWRMNGFLLLIEDAVDFRIVNFL